MSSKKSQGHDGYLHGVELLEFNGKVIGQISDEGIVIGGEEPTKVKIYSAQNRTTPVVSLTDNPGSTEFTFKLIELKPDHLIATLGGKLVGDKWVAPSQAPSAVGAMRILTKAGVALEVAKAELTAMLRGNFKHAELVYVECKLTLLADGGEDGAMAINFAPQAGSSPLPGVGG